MCRANWALSVMQGSEALVRVDVRDISEGGCFVEMHTLPPDQEQVKIMVWANNTKLAMRGIVASRRPGFGISVKFTEMTEEVRQQLRFFIESVIVKQEVGKILVDLCTGDKYKILSVAKPRDRTKLPVLPTLASRKVHRRGDRSATQRRRLYSYGRVQTFHGRSVGTDCVLEAPDVHPLGPQSRGNSGKGSG